MFYKCLECGNIFESGEEKVHYERLHPDYPICEEFRSCPACGGEYEEAVMCDGCGGYFLEDELTEGLCSECVDGLVCEYGHNAHELVKISHNDEQCEVKISRFLACMFDDDEINAILERELLKAADIIKLDCTRYIEQDREQFIKMLKKGGYIEQ